MQKALLAPSRKLVAGVQKQTNATRRMRTQKYFRQGAICAGAKDVAAVCRKLKVNTIPVR